MTPIFSVLHATYGRPDKAVEAMKKFVYRSNYSSLVEYIFAVNEDDPARERFLELLAVEKSLGIRHGHQIEVVIGNYHGSAPAWDSAARASKGRILIQGQDDIEPPLNWDDVLLNRILAYYPDHQWEDKAFAMAVSDGYRRDALMCTAICSRPYMQLEGHFLFPEFISVFSDDEFTYRALRHAHDKTATLIDARDIVFRHDHHYHTKATPWDDTYARENSAQAYRIGHKLFHERNPRVATDGLKTW